MVLMWPSSWMISDSFSLFWITINLLCLIEICQTLNLKNYYFSVQEFRFLIFIKLNCDAPEFGYWTFHCSAGWVKLPVTLLRDFFNPVVTLTCIRQWSDKGAGQIPAFTLFCIRMSEMSQKSIRDWADHQV